MTTLRSLGFWAGDRLTGGRVRAHVRDISCLMADRDLGERRRRLLAAQLLHATRSIPYYQRFGGSAELTDFPVVNKHLIRQNEHLMIDPQSDERSAYVASTSGSTGTPFRVLHDSRKRRRINADTLYWGSLAGYELGVPLYHFKVWSERNSIGRGAQILRNVVPVDVATMTPCDLLEIFDAAAKRTSRISVISYSSSLADIARAIELHRRSWPELTISSVVAQSEALPREARESLARAFGCEPVGRYGLEELGIVGQQQTGGGDDYIINGASQVVEILRENSDDPAEPGEVGRIVVTELFNRIQPMIRYDTGDLGAFALTNRGTVDERRLSKVEGRMLDRVYDAYDRPLSSMVMYKFWWRYPEIDQYQLVQRGRGQYTVRLNTSSTFTRATELLDEMRIILGAPASIDVEYTDEQFVLSSGKRRSVVSNYSPEGAQ